MLSITEAPSYNIRLKPLRAVHIRQMVSVLILIRYVDLFLLMV